MFLPSPDGPPLKIGIFRSSSIGDVVLATACIDLVERLNIPTEITWIGRQPALGLIQEAYPMIRCLDLSRDADISRSSQLIRELAPIHFLVDLQANLRSRMVAHNFRKQYGKPVFTSSKAHVFRSTLLAEARLFGRSRNLPQKALRAPRKQVELMVDAMLAGLNDQLPSELMDRLTGATPRPQLPTIHDSGQRPWQKELRMSRWLAIAPGASHEAKRAPLEVFAEIVDLAHRRIADREATNPTPFGLLIVGDHDDRQFGLQLLDKLGWQAPFLNLAGMLNLWESALALKEARCLLSNDSGLSHIAEAVGTPAAVLFGPTVEGFGFAPQLAESSPFSSPLGCRPCSKHGKAECRYQDKLCFLNISRSDVASYLTDTMSLGSLQPTGGTTEKSETLGWGPTANA